MNILAAQYTDGTQNSVQVTYDNGTVLSVPVDANNRHWQEVQAWATTGNTIASGPEPTAAAPKTLPIISGTTTEEKLQSLIQALQQQNIVIGG